MRKQEKLYRVVKISANGWKSTIALNLKVDEAIDFKNTVRKMQPIGASVEFEIKEMHNPALDPPEQFWE